jgi:hypothetical protein
MIIRTPLAIRSNRQARPAFKRFIGGTRKRNRTSRGESCAIEPKRKATASARTLTIIPMIGIKKYVEDIE